jgi:hypothetical protein
MDKGTKSEKKENEGPKLFWVAWLSSLLGDQLIERKKTSLFCL